MIFNQFVDVTSKHDAIDTFESYSMKCYFNGENLLHPIINLHLIEPDVLCNKENLLRIEFSYLLVEQVVSISWIGEDKFGKKVIGGTRNAAIHEASVCDYFALSWKGEGYELKVEYEKLKLLIPSNSRVGLEWFVPYETPNFPMNIAKETSTAFFDLVLSPELKNRIPQIETYTELQITSDDSKVEEITKNW